MGIPDVRQNGIQLLEGDNLPGDVVIGIEAIGLEKTIRPRIFITWIGPMIYSELNGRCAVRFFTADKSSLKTIL